MEQPSFTVSLFFIQPVFIALPAVHQVPVWGLWTPLGKRYSQTVDVQSPPVAGGGGQRWPLSWDPDWEEGASRVKRSDKSVPGQEAESPEMRQDWLVQAHPGSQCGQSEQRKWGGGGEDPAVGRSQTMPGPETGVKSVNCILSVMESLWKLTRGATCSDLCSKKQPYGEWFVSSWLGSKQVKLWAWMGKVVVQVKKWSSSDFALKVELTRSAERQDWGGEGKEGHVNDSWDFFLGQQSGCWHCLLK